MDHQHAGVAELADALDLGSSVNDVGVQVLFPAPKEVFALLFLYINLYFINPLNNHLIVISIND